MKTILLAVLAVLVVSPTLALAEPKPACEAKGTPIFEIDRKDTSQPKWQQAVKLYASGAWAFDETSAEGKQAKTDTGCLAADAMKTIKDELAAAKWKITVAKIKCMAISPRFTVYKANGKDVFEAHVCGGKNLDDASQKAVDDLEKQLAVAFPKG